jgi:hypothetical protein
LPIKLPPTNFKFPRFLIEDLRRLKFPFTTSTESKDVIFLSLILRLPPTSINGFRDFNLSLSSYLVIQRSPLIFNKFPKSSIGASHIPKSPFILSILPNDFIPTL